VALYKRLIVIIEAVDQLRAVSVVADHEIHHAPFFTDEMFCMNPPIHVSVTMCKCMVTLSVC